MHVRWVREIACVCVCVYREMMSEKRHGAGVCVCLSVQWWIGGLVRPAQVRGPIHMGTWVLLTRLAR